ncbi:MAG: LPS export ABC transporter permease LptG [Woeseiaceae bacterium]
MKILDRYIGQAVITGVMTVLAIFLILYELFSFAGDAGLIGKANYTLWSAIKNTLYLIPQHIYELFPLSMLMGTMLGLGWLANHNELVVIRTAGVSLMRIVVAVMKTAVMLMLLATILGEAVAPPLLQHAKDIKLKALNRNINMNTDYGLWARDDQTYINVNRVDSTGRLVGITLYLFSKENHLQRTIMAKHARYDGQQWILNSVDETLYLDDKVEVKHTKEMLWQTLLDLDMVKIVAIRPDLLSVWKLTSYMEYLKNNDLDYGRYELVYWTKIFSPLTILSMVLLAIPFVFGSTRQISLGRQILLGFFVGISFYLVSRLSGQMGLVYGVPAILSALLPNLLVISLAIWGYRRIR